MSIAPVAAAAERACTFGGRFETSALALLFSALRPQAPMLSYQASSIQ